MPSNKSKAPQPEAVKPAAIKNVRACQHIKVTGVPCGGPPMRGEQFCYFHQRMLRGVKTPPNVRIHPIALIEDEESIQASLMEIINALARNHIDLRRADLMLKALWIAVKNSRRVKFNNSQSEMVREIPDYPAPPKPVARPEPMPAIALEEEPAYIAKRRVKNTLAQLQSRALGEISTPPVANPDVQSTVQADTEAEFQAVFPPDFQAYEIADSLRAASLTPAPVPAPNAESAPSLRSVQRARPEPAEGWDLATKKRESIATAPPSTNVQTPLATKVTPIDPAQRKPPARSGAPSTIKRTAVNQGKTRT